MKTDKELLELAAKAAGIELQQWVELRNTFFLEPHQQHWNPLTDDGDALRLAVKLSMLGDLGASLFFPDQEDNTAVFQYYGGADIHITEEVTDDPYAATRRAIVRAAAEIGRAMP